MFDPTEGHIKIDGRDIASYDLESLREKIAYIPQDVFLFSDTIAHNITFGVEESDREEVIEYAKNAAVHEDIMGLQHGYDTFVGERGVTLSGGQKQRISIARAFIKDPDIIIMDDCLSAVDTSTEQQIIGYLREALQDKTTILITHRLNILSDFDRIIVLDKGKIVEEGGHKELLAKEGHYAEIFENQQLEEESRYGNGGK